jgi:ribonuclease VapC
LGQARAAEMNFIDERLAFPTFAIVAADKHIADFANSALVNYEKGSGHLAQLNFADVFSYALAKSRDIPLLFERIDFSQADVVSANL